jgi:hypothetical protein
MIVALDGVAARRVRVWSQTCHNGSASSAPRIRVDGGESVAASGSQGDELILSSTTRGCGRETRASKRERRES